MLALWVLHRHMHAPCGERLLLSVGAVLYGRRRFGRGSDCGSRPRPLLEPPARDSRVRDAALVRALQLPRPCAATLVRSQSLRAGDDSDRERATRCLCGFRMGWDCACERSLSLRRCARSLFNRGAHHPHAIRVFARSTRCVAPARACRRTSGETPRYDCASAASQRGSGLGARARRGRLGTARPCVRRFLTDIAQKTKIGFAPASTMPHWAPGIALSW